MSLYVSETERMEGRRARRPFLSLIFFRTEKFALPFSRIQKEVIDGRWMD